MTTHQQLPKDKLWTASFVSACVGNFFLFYAFYSLVPILPLYLIEEFHTSNFLVGIILSCYTLAALFVRPISGFLLDMFSRKPLYLLAYFLFVVTFIGYPLANLVNLFLVLRIVHGFTFGFVTTAANSFVVDIMPASRRGEGLGYFGISNTLAMAVGPMTSLYMHGFYSYNTIFFMAIGSGLFGLLFALRIKSPDKIEKTVKQPLAFDRFFMFKGFKAGVCLMFMGIPYGMLVTYVAIYGKELGINSGIGVFFTLMAIGLVFSRLISGKMVDKGKMLQVISIGTLFTLFAMLVLAGMVLVEPFHHVIILTMFYCISLMLGVGYGMLFPAYNTLFVNLAPNNRRATASSTYMTSWDIGVGFGLITGGFLADSSGGLPLAYLGGAVASMLSYLFFIAVAGPHFLRHKLR